MSISYNRNQNTNQPKGFMLIELLVVIAIIGLLGTLAIVTMRQAQAKARDAKRLDDISNIATALQLFANDYHEYPRAGCIPAGCGYPYPFVGFIPTLPNVWLDESFDGFLTGLAPLYFGTTPVDPKNVLISGNWYQYEYINDTNGRKCDIGHIPNPDYAGYAYLMITRFETPQSNHGIDVFGSGQCPGYPTFGTIYTNGFLLRLPKM
jgi:prepilin-type N-terminal cleavage/methylation domain-containing protein